MWPSRLARSSPFSMFQSRAVLSAEHEASVSPSGENLTQTTPLSWPVRVLRSLHSSTPMCVAGMIRASMIVSDIASFGCRGVAQQNYNAYSASRVAACAHLSAPSGCIAVAITACTRCRICHELATQLPNDSQSNASMQNRGTCNELQDLRMRAGCWLGLQGVWLQLAAEAWGQALILWWLLRQKAQVESQAAPLAARAAAPHSASRLHAAMVLRLP